MAKRKNKGGEGMSPEERIIVALDETDLFQAKGLVRELDGIVQWWKLGPALLEQDGGAEFIDWMHGKMEMPPRIMLDRKFYDIPSVLAKTIRALSGRGIEMFTIHIDVPFDVNFLRPLKDAITEKGSSKVLVVGKVSGLKSHVSLPDIVELADTAHKLGADGVVCVGMKAAILQSKARFQDLLKVVAGVRPWPVSGDDQRHSVTPREAILSGADYIVVGRPILYPPGEMSSREAFLKIVDEVDQALAQKLKMPE